MQQSELSTMVAEREQLTLALSNPNVPENRKNIYRATIKEITRRIEAIQAAAPTLTGKATATIPTNNDQIAMQSAVFNSAAGTEPTVVQPQRPTAPPPRQPAPPPQRQPASRPVSIQPPAEISVATATDTDTVTEIVWDDGYRVKVTEGQCRSALLTRLDELSRSKAALDGHMPKVLRSVTFSRAVGYYKTLCQYYGEAPSLKQLGINRPSEMQTALIEHISSAVEPK
jgi:hypothetical protein